MRSRRVLLSALLLATSAGLTAACSGSSTPTGPDERIQTDGVTVSGSGRILHTRSFGGVWYLEATGGEIYLPLALPVELRRDRLPVTFVGQLRPDIPTTSMFGMVVELSSLVAR